LQRLKLETMKNLLLIVTTLIFFISCSTDFEVNAPWEDKTVIFGMLDQSDSVQYIKINKAFLGEDNAFDMAAVSDSVNYDQLTVTLQRIRDDEVLESILMQPTNEIVKDTGIFADDNNIIYKTTEKIYRGSTYKLIVEFNNYDKVVSAETAIVDTFKIDRPLYIQSGPEVKINFAQTQPTIIRWQQANHSKICYFNIYFNYFDISETDTIEKQIHYSLSPKVFTGTDNTDAYGNVYSYEKYVYGEDFYKYVASALVAPPEGTKRLAESLDFEFYCGTDDYYTYYQVNNTSSGISQSTPLFTNIDNGYGLFTSKYKQVVYDKHLNPESLDSLADGRYTGHLKFADSNQRWD
jgi:hypothetical protein